ncbi:MAG: hypothetical protein JRM80_13810 [Nitrososphaerota archaeon]|nr:hypothetical protein [Nitrososphaerota archaeon]
MVLAAALLLLPGLYLNTLASSNVKVTSGVLQRDPGFPGLHTANVYLTINYTGMGRGEFDYVVSWNGTSDGGSAYSQHVLLAPHTAFTFWLCDPPSASAVSVVTMRVYGGGPGSNPLYSQTLVV